MASSTSESGRMCLKSIIMANSVHDIAEYVCMSNAQLRFPKQRMLLCEYRGSQLLLIDVEYT